MPSRLETILLYQWCVFHDLWAPSSTVKPQVLNRSTAQLAEDGNTSDDPSDRSNSLEATSPNCKSLLVGGFSPTYLEKYAQVKMCSSSPILGVKIQQCLKPPPDVWFYSYSFFFIVASLVHPFLFLCVRRVMFQLSKPIIGDFAVSLPSNLEEPALNQQRLNHYPKSSKALDFFLFLKFSSNVLRVLELPNTPWNTQGNCNSQLHGVVWFSLSIALNH